MGGKAARSCVTPLSAAAGKEVVTIEGLADNDTLHAVQQAFLREELSVRILAAAQDRGPSR